MNILAFFFVLLLFLAGLEGRMVVIVPIWAGGGLSCVFFFFIETEYYDSKNSVLWVCYHIMHKRGFPE